MLPTDAELFDLIATEALIDRSKLQRDVTIEALGIDSVDIVTVIFAVEEKYGACLETDELSREQTLGQLLDLVRSKAVAASPS